MSAFAVGQQVVVPRDDEHRIGTIREITGEMERGHDPSYRYGIEFSPVQELQWYGPRQIEAVILEPVPEEPWDTEDVVVRHVPEQFIIENAPERMTISLALLVGSHGIRVTGDLLYIGSPDEVAYEVVGLHPYPLGIRCRKLLHGKENREQGE